MYILYDNQNRAKETGFTTTTATHESLQQTVGQLNNYEPSNKSALAYSYYDDYNFVGAQVFNASKNISGYVDKDGNSNGYYDNIFGLSTGSKVKELDGISNSKL